MQIRELVCCGQPLFCLFLLAAALPNGRPCEETVISKAFQRLKRDAQVSDVVFHSLRHSSTAYKLKLNHGDGKAMQDKFA